MPSSDKTRAHVEVTDGDGAILSVGDTVEVTSEGSAQRVGLRAKVHGLRAKVHGFIDDLVDLRWVEHPSGGANHWLVAAKYVRKVARAEAKSRRALAPLVTDEPKTSACDLCSDQGPLVLRARCHLTAPLQVELEGDILIVRCYVPTCRREVARFGIVSRTLSESADERDA